jgi:hypothetical protein
LRLIESDIIKRASTIRHSGNLFAANPLRFLKEIGVLLSDKAQDELLKYEPRLRVTHDRAYAALRASPYPQAFTIQFRGLFPSKTKEDKKP